MTPRGVQGIVQGHRLSIARRVPPPPGARPEGPAATNPHARRLRMAGISYFFASECSNSNVTPRAPSLSMYAYDPESSSKRP